VIKKALTNKIVIFCVCIGLQQEQQRVAVGTRKRASHFWSQGRRPQRAASAAAVLAAAARRLHQSPAAATAACGGAADAAAAAVCRQGGSL